MLFELKGIAQSNFKHINDFFSTNNGPGFVEKVQELSLPLVKIHSREWMFDGIRMGYSDWHYKKPGKLGWNYEIKDDLITFQANLRGSVFIGDRGEPMFSNRQHNLFYSAGGEASEGFLASDGVRATMFLMQFTREAFLHLTEGASESLNRFNEGVMARKASILNFRNLPLNPAMANLIQSLVNCPYDDGLKRMFLLSKSIEFLVMQAEMCSAALQTSYRYIKTRRDEEAIAHAFEYVTGQLAKPPGLSELARIVGINEYKLKRGFKETYGTTVFGYIANARLEMAKGMIMNSDKSIGEIAQEVGYSSPQHFSSAFRKKFGITASALKNVKI